MCLRYAVFNLSNGKALADVTQQATNYFLSNARNPGLDVGGINTYELAMDYCAIIKNLLEYLSRLSLLTLQEIKSLPLSKEVTWQFLSHIDDSGVLHRWKFVDAMPEDVLPELHSWEVFGDIAAAEVPMVLHLVSIGRRNGSHQNSPWCKIYSHPRLGRIYRFKKKSSGEPDGDWKPLYFSGNFDNKSADWVDMMLKENMMDGLVKHVQVRDVSPKHVAEFKRDVLVEAAAMQSMGSINPKSIPMSRYACDHPYACPHQLYCYSPDVTLDTVGIYKARTKKEIRTDEPVSVR